MISRQHGPYHWLESAERTIGELLAAAPAILAGKYVVVTAFDSGPLQLMQEEIDAGWTVEDGLTYSPKIVTVESVPRGEYDEWYIFDFPARMRVPEVFVNYSGFSLRDPACMMQNLDPTWERSRH